MCFSLLATSSLCKNGNPILIKQPAPLFHGCWLPARGHHPSIGQCADGRISLFTPTHTDTRTSNAPVKSKVVSLDEKQRRAVLLLPIAPPHFGRVLPHAVRKPRRATEANMLIVLYCCWLVLFVQSVSAKQRIDGRKATSCWPVVVVPLAFNCCSRNYLLRRNPFGSPAVPEDRWKIHCTYVVSGKIQFENSTYCTMQVRRVT